MSDTEIETGWRLTVTRHGAEARAVKHLYSRHRLDIQPNHLLAALAAMTATDRRSAARRLEAIWSADRSGLACYSVRSGFHLLLTALDLPVGGEVVFSAVTHPDMPRLAEQHGLTAIPVDLDPETLAPRLDALQRAIGPRTRVVVVAHLFGGRVDLEPIARECRRGRVLLVEDCAQAFGGPEDTGDPRAPVSMFSFGILKTATALGGAMLTVRDPRLRERMREIQRRWPVQSRRSHLKRIAQTVSFVGLTRPAPYALVAHLCAALGVDFDRLVNSAAKAFPAGSTAELVRRLELQPGAPLLRLMADRLLGFDHARLLERAASGARLAELLPDGTHVGGAALDHTHWLFPIVTDHAGELIAAARAVGFDAARSASSVQAIAAPADRPDLEPLCARRVMSRLVFVPTYPELPRGSLERLAAAIGGIEHVVVSR
jgi:perosamine synthetase